MSLTSASKLVGGIKEYTYRGIQQLPIIIGGTSLLYTVTTGSLAHMNLAVGMGLVIPLYTYIFQAIIQFIMNYFWPHSIFWKRRTGDTCDIIPNIEKSTTLEYYTKDDTKNSVVPSYWLTGVSFFLGYALSNGVDSLTTPAAIGSNEIYHEKRNTHAIFLIVATVIFAVLILSTRFFYSSGCEGMGGGGFLLSLLGGLGAGGLGKAAYDFSRACGARTSDLFGILSQILPGTAKAPAPIVCTAE
jgi:hypothetical protein